MRRGYNPALVLDEEGRLVGIATGSDATTEHECGSKKLQESLTAVAHPSKEDVARALSKKLFKKMPDLIAGKRITRNLDDIVYLEDNEHGEPQAVLLYSSRHRLDQPSDTFGNSELSFASFGDDQDIAGAWDEGSFGFRVKGAQKVTLLRNFAAALKRGGGMFAGLFLKSATGRRELSGVIIAIEKLLPATSKVAMQEAQAAFEADVRLFMKSKTDELRKLSYGLKGRSITHIWPVWQDRVVDGDVLYAMNPGYNVDAAYWGPYTFEQLRDWLSAGAATPLRPLVTA